MKQLTYVALKILEAEVVNGIRKHWLCESTDKEKRIKGCVEWARELLLQCKENPYKEMVLNYETIIKHSLETKKMTIEDVDETSPGEGYK